MMKTPDMNAENAFLLMEAAKAADAGYSDHLAHGGKGDPAEERWIEALNAGATALAYIQQLEAELEIREIQKNAMFAKAEQLERERDFLLKYLTDSTFAPCDICKYGAEGASVMDCKHIREVGIPCFEWIGLPEDDE